MDESLLQPLSSLALQPTNSIDKLLAQIKESKQESAKYIVDLWKGQQKLFELQAENDRIRAELAAAM